MNIQPVKFPVELQSARADVLEEYVQHRIAQIVTVFTRRIQANAPGLPGDIISKSLSEAFAAVPPPEYTVIPLEQRDLQLVFRHDCMALGCLDPQCALCQHNPNRRCVVNFDRKYLVNDVLKARCGACIRIELVDRNTGLPIEEDIADLRLETYILDGNLYDNKFLEGGKIIEGGTEPEEELEACALMLNKKKNTPLLVCGVGGVNDAQGKVIMPMPRGNKVTLPDLHVSDSSEAILSGRKPPFRLLVRALLQEGRPPLKIRHAISEGFVVATRRTRTAGKVEIPSLEDHVSKLEHMGKETVRKLQDIQASGMQVGIEIDLPDMNCIQKVGDFKALALRAEQDGHLRQRLQHVLKLSREKWEEAREHAMRAVKGDSLLRVWYADRRATEMGLLFACRLGSVELERPVALIQTRLEGGEPMMEATMITDLVPMQRELVHRMQPQAAHSWWLGGHPGWAIFPVDSEQFMQSGSLSTVPQLDQAPQMGLPQFQAGPSGPGLAPGMPQRQQGMDPGKGLLQGSPMMGPPQGWAPGLPMMGPNGHMAPMMMPPPSAGGMPMQQHAGAYPGFAPSRPHQQGGRALNPFADVAAASSSGGGPSQQQQQQQGRSTTSSGGGGGVSSTGGPGSSRPGSTGGTPHPKRPHEPMLEPTPSGSHEQSRREYVGPSSGTMAPPPPPHRLSASNAQQSGQMPHGMTAGSVAAAAAAAAAQVAAAEAAGSGGNPNPFVSIQNHPSPELAPIMAHLQGDAAPSLDLNALASLPMDPTMFNPQPHHLIGGAHQHARGQQHPGGQMPPPQQQQQPKQDMRGPGVAHAHVALAGGPAGAAQADNKVVGMSMGFGGMSSAEFDKVMMLDNMEGSLNLGNSLQLPQSFLQSMLNSTPGGYEGALAAAARQANLGQLQGPPMGVNNGGGLLPSQGSALDTMQSIEQALPSVSPSSGR